MAREFQGWWAALNAQLAKRGAVEAAFGDAHGLFEEGVCPTAAAVRLGKAREVPMVAEVVVQGRPSCVGAE